MRRLFLWSALAGLAVGYGGCGRPGAPPPLSLLADVVAQRYAVGGAPEGGLWFPAAPSVENATIGGERRRVVVTDAGGWEWRGVVPAGARLHAGVQLVSDARPGGAVRFELTIESRGRRTPLRMRRPAGAAPGWLDCEVDLAGYAGTAVSMRARAILDEPGNDGIAAPGDSGEAVRVGWSDAAITGVPTAPAAAPASVATAKPNVLFIVVDTLRADHLSAYGYPRATSPNVDRELAARGVLVEHAYSQAPWTLPSMLSVFSSRMPGEVLAAEMGAFGVPPGVGTMAEWMSRQGYRTAGFFANPTLHSGNGFDRGFDTFHTPPPVTESMHGHAESINARALPWLRAHQTEPFFLVVHYLDPHDPYDNAEVVEGRSPFYPDYRGGISGQWIHGIYNGRIPLQDPAEDLRHLTALYDTEIHYVDARIGELLGAIDPGVLADTLVVLTADHGEELLDHGGWKHGQTLYEEQIHVPLILRWDGRLPPGRRLPGPVRLLDVLPTLAAAVGGAADPSWQGVNLLPALAGSAPQPRLPVFAQHLSHGPLRAAAIVDGKKLMLFNDRAPFVPADGLQELLWTQDLRRLRRQQLFDLQSDPRELVDLAPDVAAVQAREPFIHRQLDRQLPGLRIVASGLPAGARLEGTIRLDRPPARWSPYFLAESDRVQGGAATSFALGADLLEKGFLLEGDFEAVTAIETRWAGGAPHAPHVLDAAAPPPIRVLLGSGEAYAGGAVPLARLASSDTPAVPDGPVLRIWLRTERGIRAAHQDENAETVARLRALGYIP